MALLAGDDDQEMEMSKDIDHAETVWDIKRDLASSIYLQVE